MKMWIAKHEKQSYLVLFKEKPVKRFDKFTRGWWWESENMCNSYMTLEQSDYPEVTFENSPMEVELKLKNKMTRKEEINQMAERYAHNEAIGEENRLMTYRDFVNGAEQADKTNALELFKKLPHLNSNKNIVADWGYIPNLYHFDQSWHVSWIHCEEGDTLIDFVAETPEEAIKKAFDWCVELKLIEK